MIDWGGWRGRRRGLCIDFAHHFSGLTLPLPPPPLSSPQNPGIYSTSITLANCEAASIQEPYALFCGEDANGCHIEVYPRPDGKIYMCGLGGSDYVSGSRLAPGGDCDRPEKIVPNPQRVAAAMKSFSDMSPSMAKGKEPEAAACMRPCSQDGLPILGKVPTARNAYLATALNQWGILGTFSWVVGGLGFLLGAWSSIYIFSHDGACYSRVSSLSSWFASIRRHFLISSF